MAGSLSVKMKAGDTRKASLKLSKAHWKDCSVSSSRKA
jgi:hypothetical protein